MKSLLRPYTYLGTAILAGAGLALVAAPPGLTAQSGVSHILRELNPLLSHTPGYLGVLVTDVDEDSYQKLRLKDRSGALITLIDHDAPAGTVLHVNDVITEVNGQKIEGEEQFSRVMREFPIGRKVTLAIIRDGAQQSFTLQLVDRKVMEQQAWSKMNSSDDVPPPPSGMGFSNGSNGVGGWHMSLFAGALNVGVMVEALTGQMADYLNIPSGVMVKQVAHKSEAAAAGLKPYDIVLKVGNDPIATTADWDRGMRANEGRSVPVTILRDRKQQVVIIQVDSKHSKHSRVEWPGFLFHSAHSFLG
ncbi:MAG TPA: PDZ domain-containing protein [Terracidiphilus sp.]|nr:PDZ domain-containing protein [Terracidiphilus sp.]